MTNQGSTAEDPTESATTSAVDAIQQSATGSSVTSSTRGVDFYFQCAVIVIGVVGTVANALVLYAMVAAGQHKKQVLIFNQNALDCVSCFFLVVTFAAKLPNVYLTGTSGYWLCMILLSEILIWSPITGSMLNLAAITVERYLKVVHSSSSKKWLRKWMLYLECALAWAFGIALTTVVTSTTTAVVDGACYAQVFWVSQAVQMVYGIWYFLSFEVILLAIFVFCYWRILMTIRRQAKVLASHTVPGPSSTQPKISNVQSNVVKTMCIVSVLFALSWTPMNIYYIFLILDPAVTLLQSAYYTVLFIAFLYICTNPFVYAIKFDPVKRVLLRLIPCKNNSVQPAVAESIEVT